MVLYKLDDYYPDYKESFGGHDIQSFDVYADNNDKVGSVNNILVDESSGRFRYFIVDTGSWFSGKQVLLPFGLAQLDSDDKRVYVPRLTKQQVEDLPEFTEDLRIDNDYEERIRGIYSPIAPTFGMGMGMPVAGLGSTGLYDYDLYPGYYNATGHSRDYEERLLARRRDR